MYNGIGPRQGAIGLAQVGQVGHAVVIGPTAHPNMIYAKNRYAGLGIGVFDSVSANEAF